jgi:DNA-binding response OmpR family regulator
MGTQQILAVDDNENLLFLIETVLESAGYDVVTAASAKEALTLMERHGLPHLALVDIMMPEMNGFELGQAIRQTSDMPIIFLTAVDNERSVVEGLEHYADDYIVKPFHVDELVARVQRVLRRVDDFAYRADPVIWVDEHLQLDLDGEQAIVAGETVSLTPTELKLLDILVANRGRVVTTDRLLQRVWPLERANEDRLYVAVYRLRQKLQGETGKWDYIATKSGLGYVFQGPAD